MKIEKKSKNRIRLINIFTQTTFSESIAKSILYVRIPVFKGHPAEIVSENK
jgi:hypothetical protein